MSLKEPLMAKTAKTKPTQTSKQKAEEKALEQTGPNSELLSIRIPMAEKAGLENEAAAAGLDYAVYVRRILAARASLGFLSEGRLVEALQNTTTRLSQLEIAFQRQEALLQALVGSTRPASRSAN
jgi:predicted DNA binding CopG/RHH family protein